MDKQTSSIEKAEEQLLQLINTNDINWDDLMRRLLSDETLEDIAKALTQERAWRMAENIAASYSFDADFRREHMELFQEMIAAGQIVAAKNITPSLEGEIRAMMEKEYLPHLRKLEEEYKQTHPKSIEAWVNTLSDKEKDKLRAFAEKDDKKGKEYDD